jgi:hypothetical protein
MRVGRLIAMWKMDNFFAVEGLLIHRQHEWIGDYIVDETGAHRSRKADETHLYGSRSLRGNPGARAFREARQFDKYIDPIGFYAPRRLVVGHRADIDAFIESLAQPRAELAAVV